MLVNDVSLRVGAGDDSTAELMHLLDGVQRDVARANIEAQRSAWLHDELPDDDRRRAAQHELGTRSDDDLVVATRA